MADVFYSLAGDYKIPDASLATNLCSPFLRSVVEAFIANVGSVRASWMFNPYIIEHACHNMSALYVAIFEETRHVPLTKAEAADLDLQKRIKDRIDSAIEERMKPGLTVEQAIGFSQKRALERFDELVKTFPSWDGSIQAALKSQLIGIWTAYEVLVSDIWIATLNEKPILSKGWMKSNPKDQEKSISLSLLHKTHFDLRKCLGSIFVESGKVSFLSLAFTRDAYERIFESIPNSLLDDPYLRILELTRNLFAHRAGKIDEKFIREMQSLSHPFGGLKIDEGLRLTGEIVRDLNAVVVSRGTELIKFADEWLTTHP